MNKKQQISITVDENILKTIDDKIKEGIFRNRSHGFELAAKKQLANQESG
ncbi:ribbon-helix-helix domain-containing protein [Thermodesulfobacteriota bacterium]